MRRVSSTDIVVSADDRISGSAPAARRGRGDARDASDPKPKAKPKRKVPRLRFDFTPLQKLAAGGVAMTALVVGSAVIWHSGVIQRTAQDGVTQILALTAQAGFKVGDITVSGRTRTPTGQIVAALGTKHGDPILGVNIGVVKDRLELIDSVKSAAVERRLPDQLHLAIVERTPVAIWQNGGQFTLVDRDGHQIPGPIAGFEGLPLVVGDGAAGRADELLTLLASEPKLANRVKAAIRVGGRRWNLKLDSIENGIEVRLPEDGFEAAWHKLANLEKEHRLTDRQITMIDLRVPDRLIMRTDRESADRQNAETAKRKDDGA